MKLNKVTDPALLESLNTGIKKVTDPKLLAELNADQNPAEEEIDAGEYLDNLPAPEGSHPFRDVLIGLTHAGRNAHNLPHDLVKGFEESSKGIGNLFNDLPGKQENHSKPISSYLPNDERDFADIWGQKGEGTLLDSIIQKGAEYAPELIGGGAAAYGGIRRLKGTHQLDKAAKLIKEKELSGFNYPQKMIEEARKILPKTEATKELIAGVNEGQYKPAFTMQSQVGHHQRKLAKSPLASENSIMAPKAAELKQKMLGHLEKVLRDSNNVEEADYIKNGVSNYRQYKQVMEKSKKVLKKLGIPTTILASLGLVYAGGKKLLAD